MTTDEVKTLVRYGELMVIRNLQAVSAGVGYFIPASEAGRMLKAAMKTQEIAMCAWTIKTPEQTQADRDAWIAKAEELEAFK